MWALAPSASAWQDGCSSPSSWSSRSRDFVVRGFWFWSWLSSFLPSLPLSATTTGPDIPRLRRQHSLPERIACTVLGRPPPACPPQSLSSCRFAPGQPICLHTHTHTNSGRHPPPDEASYRLSLISQHFYSRLSAGARPLSFLASKVSHLSSVYLGFRFFIFHTTLSILPYLTYYTILRYTSFLLVGLSRQSYCSYLLFSIRLVMVFLA